MLVQIDLGVVFGEGEREGVESRLEVKLGEGSDGGSYTKPTSETSRGSANRPPLRTNLRIERTREPCPLRNDRYLLPFTRLPFYIRSHRPYGHVNGCHVDQLDLEAREQARIACAEREGDSFEDALGEESAVSSDSYGKFVECLGAVLVEGDGVDLGGRGQEGDRRGDVGRWRVRGG